MFESVIISGFGGQGTLFAGQLLTYAGMFEGRHVTWMPSYGPEMRGGTARCTVIISDEPIGSPIVMNPNIAVVMNPDSYEKYEPLVPPGGLLVVNSTLVRSKSARKDITVVEIPATDIATEMGNTRMANVVLLGALLATRPLVKPESVKQAMEKEIPASRARIIEPNKQALDRGIAYVKEGVKA
jgi:2-oxoglutarate ferredoxin oxidoreductase subunit gamma